MIGGDLSYLRAPFIRNIEPGEKVLLLTDTEHDPRVWQLVATILAELRADYAVALFDPRPADYYDPPGPVCDAMQRSDVNVLLASTGMLHCDANFRAMKAEVPAICMDGGMTLEMFQSGAVTEDWTAVARMKHYVAKRVFGAAARECRVTSRHGTDLTYRVDGRIFIPPLPEADFDPWRIVKFDEAEGRSGGALYFFLHPTGEFNVPPIEGSGSGRLVIDLTMHHLGRLQSPIELTVEAGRVTAINGGPDAHALRQYLETYGDENAYMCPAEASVGVNRRALIRGIQREDKNIFGAMHFGLGTNVDVGGSVKSTIHMDGVILEPTLYVDGEKRIEDGKFLVDIGQEN